MVASSPPRLSLNPIRATPANRTGLGVQGTLVGQGQQKTAAKASRVDSGQPAEGSMLPLARLHSAVTLGQAAPRVARVQFIEILGLEMGVWCKTERL